MKNQIKFLFVGRPVISKGFHDLIQALCLLKTNNWHLGLVGDIHYDQLPIVSRNLKYNIKLYGSIKNELLNPIYNDYDVVVVPSHYENFGHVALEAMAAGRPVIAARTGGLPSLIKDNITGLLFQPFNVEELSSKLTYACENRKKLIHMGKEGKRVAQRYSWHKVMNEFEQVLLRFV